MKLLSLDSLKLFYKKLKNLFYTKSESDNRFLNLGGGSINGDLTVNGNFRAASGGINAGYRIALNTPG